LRLKRSGEYSRDQKVTPRKEKSFETNLFENILQMQKRRKLFTDFGRNRCCGMVISSMLVYMDLILTEP
jgi:hypothetical protein